MKHNTYIHFIIIVLFSVILCSCEENKTSNNTTPSNQEVVNNTNINVNKDTIKQVESKLENIQSQVVEVSKKSEYSLNELKNNIKETNARYTWCFLIAVAISVISLIIVLISIIRISKLIDRLNRHRYEIEQLRGDISNINFRPHQVKPTSNPDLRSEFNKLATRITKIENELTNNAINANNRDSNRRTNIHKEDPKEISKTGYFGPAISGEVGTGYFKKLLDSIEDARFRVAIIDDNTATFEPMVPLNAIKSSDAMDLAIEFEGVSKNEATAMSIKHKGKATKVGDKWIIINKAVVTLN